MVWFPALRLGWLNGWIFLPFVYLSTEGLAKSLPKDVSAKLFDHGGWTRRDETIALLSGLPALAYFILLILTPLTIGSWLLPLGAGVFVVGAAACAHSILMFARTPEGEPITGGLYRFSRNPQTIGAFVSILGASLAIGSGIAMLACLVWGISLHARVLAEERTCLARYGEAYRQYRARVPRYLVR
jgi:protein-S-isoprenylcysteine O-methyltransferase Ste14